MNFSWKRKRKLYTEGGGGEKLRFQRVKRQWVLQNNGTAILEKPGEPGTFSSQETGM
jgi:hypothetical protein